MQLAVRGCLASLDMPTLPRLLPYRLQYRWLEVSMTRGADTGTIKNWLFCKET